MIRTRRFRLSRLAAPVAALALVAAPVARATPRPYQPPEAIVRTLPNGLTVAVRVDHRLPIVQAQLLVNAGSAMEGPLEPGLATLTAGLLMQGTASRSHADIVSDLARLGGTIDANAGREVATVSGAFGAADFDTGLELLADVAIHPTFPAEEIDNAKNRQANQILRAQRDPSELAEQHAIGLALAGDPLARPPGGVLAALANLGRPQVQDFHRRYWRPDHALLAIAGDVDPERAVRLATEQFGDWAGTSAAAPVATPVAAPGSLHIRLVDLPDLPRPEIRLALAGPARNAPDADALSLACAILGGDADARLARAGAGLTPRVTWNGFRRRGIVLVGTSSRTDSVVAAIRAVRDGLRRFGDKPPTETEVTRVSRRGADGYALGFETLGGWISQWFVQRAYGLPEDHLQRHAERLAAVTTAQVAEAGKKWLVSQPATLVVVGPARALKKPLAALGEVEVVPADAPPAMIALPPSQQTASPRPDEEKRGRDLVAQALVAHGGRAAIQRGVDSAIEGSVRVTTDEGTLNGTLRELRLAPDHYLLSTVVEHALSTGSITGSRGWMTTGADGDSVLEADSVAVTSLRAGFVSDIQHVLLAASSSTSRVAARGREALDGHETDVVEVIAADGHRQVLFLNPADHRVAGMEQSEAITSDEPMTVQRVWGDYRLVGGVWWPFNEERRVLDRTVMVVQLRDVKLGAGLTSAAFARPVVKKPGSSSGKQE
jgi:predicted Zn-dependent peptidase